MAYITSCRNNYHVMLSACTILPLGKCPVKIAWTSIIPHSAWLKNNTQNLNWSTQSCCNILYPSETRIQLKFCENLFAHNLLYSCQIILQLCIEHGSITAMPWANFQNDSTNDMDILEEWDSSEFPIDILQQTSCTSCQYSTLTWWHHQMKTFSVLLALCVGIHRSPVNSPHKGQWHGVLMFSLIYVRINGWVNNGEAGDLGCYWAHYDITVMMGNQWGGLCEFSGENMTKPY